MKRRCQSLHGTHTALVGQGTPWAPYLREPGLQLAEQSHGLVLCLARGEAGRSASIPKLGSRRFHQRLRPWSQVKLSAAEGRGHLGAQQGLTGQHY